MLLHVKPHFPFRARKAAAHVPLADPSLHPGAMQGTQFVLLLQNAIRLSTHTHTQSFSRPHWSSEPR